MSASPKLLGRWSGVTTASRAITAYGPAPIAFGKAGNRVTVAETRSRHTLPWEKGRWLLNAPSVPVFRVVTAAATL